MSSPEEDDVPTRRAKAQVGQLLRGKWRLDSLLGTGGMASVFAATHRNGKRGALKMLHLELCGDDEARKRFLQEGYAANKVDHPGAVSVLDDDVTENGAVFLVMELLDGESVDARATARPAHRLTAEEVVTIADQLLDVLAAAHDKEIVHRDIKPENLFITRPGQLKVLDFGIARVRELESQRLTRTGISMGTPAFMAPEQALGNWQDVGPRSDLWAVGATMFTLLTGRLVHEADTVNKLLLAAMTRPAPKLETVLPGVPPALAAVVDRALSFEIKDRWPDARTMQQAVRASLGAPGFIARAPAPIAHPTLRSSGVPALSAPAPRPPQISTSTVSPVSSDRSSGGRAPAVVGAGVLAGVVVAAGLFFALRGGGEHPSPATSEPPHPSSSPTVALPAEPSPSIARSAAPTVEPALAPTINATTTAPLPSARPAPSVKVVLRPAPSPSAAKKPKDPLEKF